MNIQELIDQLERMPDKSIPVALSHWSIGKTVQELIEHLGTIPDKSKTISFYSWTNGNVSRTVHELEKNRLVIQPHKLNILTD